MYLAYFVRQIRLGNGFKINAPFKGDNTPIYATDLEEGVLGKANNNGTILISDKITEIRYIEIRIKNYSQKCYNIDLLMADSPHL